MDEPHQPVPAQDVTKIHCRKGGDVQRVLADAVPPIKCAAADICMIARLVVVAAKGLGV